ncbi:MAG: HAMP domain-containing histidine kinase [Eubacterium sp.]|jgi:signal transduction histidine kinase|nr:HAMP domain-containing histidine kinase [Eubacterium sp.]
MKNSILTKFFIGYFSFAVLGFLLITYWSTNLIYNHLLQEDAKELNNYSAIVAENIAHVTESSLDDIENPDEFFSDFNEVLDCNILILDSEKKLIYTTDKTQALSTDANNIVIEDFNPNDYTKGKYRINKLYNIYKTNTLSVVHNIEKNNTIYGYVVAHMPTSFIKKSSYDVTFIFFVTYVIILILSLIIFFNFMWFIYLPLKQIRLAAMEYAKGNFKYEGLKVNNDDEIGDVASSLKYMSKQLNNSREYQKNFISNISHDFRSPLTSIKGYIEAMMDGTIPPEEHNKYLSIVLSEANRLEKLTTGLRDLNSWSSTGPELIFEEFNMENVVASTVETFQGSCEKKHIELIIQFPPKHYNAYADKGKIEQVLYNLLDNAIKFSNAGSKIIIKIYNRGDKIYCSVKDFGMGIPAGSLDKIWQRFYKTDLSRGRDKTGSGIGLAIVKEIIMAHNEHIDVISTEGVGTEFVFSLKRAKK